MTGEEIKDKCPKCDGCGQVADTKEQEPWTAWLDLKVAEAAAVLSGLVRPIKCPACGGTGKRGGTDGERAALSRVR